MGVTDLESQESYQIVSFFLQFVSFFQNYNSKYFFIKYFSYLCTDLRLKPETSKVNYDRKKIFIGELAIAENAYEVYAAASG